MAATANRLQVDPSNAEAAAAWDGDEGAYWAARAQRFDESVAAYHEKLLAAAAIGPASRVLDIGCGTGQTTRDAARTAASGSALGVDLSSQMIGLARQLAAAEGIGNARFEQADAQIRRFGPRTFDAVISRTGTMFFADPVAAFTNIASALRPPGRLTLLVWQGPEHNEWLREFAGAMAAGRDLPAPPPGAPGPFAFADPGRARTVLAASGFADITFDGLAAPMYFGPDPDDAYTFVLGLTGWMLDGLDDRGRGRALDALRATTAAHCGASGVTYDSATWIITARKR
jgi:SAM-dependent methyltransferase